MNKYADINQHELALALPGDLATLALRKLRSTRPKHEWERWVDIQAVAAVIYERPGMHTQLCGHRVHDNRRMKRAKEI